MLQNEQGPRVVMPLPGVPVDGGGGGGGQALGVQLGSRQDLLGRARHHESLMQTSWA